MTTPALGEGLAKRWMLTERLTLPLHALPKSHTINREVRAAVMGVDEVMATVALYRSRYSGWNKPAC
ncbi:MAG: hypothetical protein ABIW02_01710 [Nitrosospira sp.]